MDDNGGNISKKSIEFVSKIDKNFSNENELIANETIMNNSLPYVPVYTRLMTYNLAPIERPQTPPVIKKLRLKSRKNCRESNLRLGGDIFSETITSNVSEDIITLEFQRSDGTLVTQLIDFRNKVQVIKVLVLGEEERGQHQYQVMCFVNYYYKMDFISSDAMSKLRQKNPGTIRIAEEDRGYTNYTMDLFLDATKSKLISKHIVTFCNEAADSTYTRNDDIKQWIQRLGISESLLMTAVHNFTSISVRHPGINNTTRSISITKCADTSNLWASCSCALELCIGWYPCGLKFCKDEKKLSVG
ncbi:hypothetical protein PV326_005411 [Microctonus aethiopoides]|nr:hypothetical protein PV326_005411 [Microctonus aethiopoides]